MPLRLAFMGTPDFAVPALQALIDAGHTVAAVYSQPPRPAGRGHRTQPSPVHRLAQDHGIAVRTPRTLRDADAQAAFAALGLDAAVVAAYGLILPKPVLEAPRLGCLNIHASLLPRWRGAAPIQRAILAGDTESGITIMAMDEGLDTGAMILRQSVPIGPQTTGAALHDRLAALGARMIVPALDGIAAGTLTPEPQPEDGACYARKIGREDAVLAWQDAAQVDRQIRALNPWPGTAVVLDGEPVKILAADLVPEVRGPAGVVVDDRLTIACAVGGGIRPTRLQRPGRAAMDTAAVLRGFPIAAGTCLMPPDA
ncbi:MAG: methionyl-tRNA formyltransferase [Rhodospirillaceae bacterium]|nr:methionyl-tRNA formyltransferase [Rhodospirillaceae bacterium]